MANVWFCSDLHFGHKNISKFRKEVASQEDNEDRILKELYSWVTKRDILYVLGDAAFTQEGLYKLKDVPGRKILVRGNHDRLKTQQYLEVFEEVESLLSYKGFWLSHAPVHPNELRGKKNLHGHVHYATIGGDYFNCCPENLWPMYGRCIASLSEVHKFYEIGGFHD